MLSGIQQRLELVHGVAELVCAAKLANDFRHVAVLRDRGDFQHVGQRELEFAVGGVFLQQVAQDFARLGGEVVEEAGLLPLHSVGALAAGEQRRVEGEMAQQVERVGVRLARLNCERPEINPPLVQLLDNLCPLFQVAPACPQLNRAVTD